MVVQPFQTTLRGYRAVSPAERAGFGMLSAFSATIGIARAVNYVRERQRPTPRVRSLARRARKGPRNSDLRIHHFIPGIATAFVAGGAAILALKDRGELWFSLPFGAGAGLTLDEIAVLVDVDNPYWRSERLVLAQASLAALGTGALAARFYRRGVSLPKARTPDKR